MKKSIITLAVTGMLVGCGSSGEGASTPSSDVVEQTPPSAVQKITTLSGYVGNRSIKHADISAYKFVNGDFKQFSSEELGNSILKTDTNGRYELQISDYKGPVKVVITPNESTIAICEATIGCGDKAFSESMTYEEIGYEFNLSSIGYVQESDDSVQLNVSTMSHLTAGLIANQSVIDADVISTISANVASLFTLEATSMNLTPASIYNIEALSNEQNIASIRYAVFNSGISNAIYDGELNTVTDRLSTASDDLINANGHMLINDDGDNEFELSIQNTYAGAVSAAQHLSNLMPLDKGIKLHELAVTISNEKQTKMVSNSIEQRISPTPRTPTAGSDVDKAKAIVNDVRVFANLFDVQQTNSIIPRGQQFKNLFDNSAILIKNEIHNFSLISDVVSAVSKINKELNSKDITGTSFNIAEYVTNPNILGTVVLDKVRNVFIINASVNDEVIQITASIQTHANKLTEKISINGNLENDSFSLKLNESSYANLSFNTVESDRKLEEVKSGNLKLEVSILSKQESSPISFNGQLELDFIINIQRKDLHRVVVIPNNMLLLGDFKDLEMNDSIFSVLTIMVPNANENLDVNNYQELNSLKIDAAISTSVELNNYKVSLLLYKDGITDGSNGLHLTANYKLPDSNKQRNFSVNYEDESETFYVTNPDQITMKISRSPTLINGEQKLGDITYKSTELARLVKRNSLTLIKYKDGSIETL